MTSDLYLTKEEIRFITGERAELSQRECLTEMGYQVIRRPDGTFWVPRQQFYDHGGSKKKTPKLQLAEL